MVRFHKRKFTLLTILLLILSGFLIYHKNRLFPVKQERNESDFYNDWKNLVRYKIKLTSESIQPIVQNLSIPPIRKTGHPLILVWTKYFGGDPLNILENFTESSCDHVCEYTKDRTRFTEADAVLFQAHSIKKNENPILRSLSRPFGQFWIYHNLEPPSSTGSNYDDGLVSFPGSFNWTMTYRRDSDIYFPYGSMVKTPPISLSLWEEIQIKRNYKNMNKTKLVVWAVSHCVTESKREGLVRDLQRYISIDIVGNCGNRRYCKRVGIDYDTCFGKFETNYKFYLSFESNICQDYVTEKFFNPMRHDIVPIVYSGADLDRMGVPHGSYIDMRDFNSSQHLGEYLLYLDKNPEEYAKYFEHKQSYRILGQGDLSWCNLCDKLYMNRVSEIYPQWYPDVAGWYENEYHERKPTGVKMCVHSRKIRFKVDKWFNWLI